MVKCWQKTKPLSEGKLSDIYLKIMLSKFGQHAMCVQPKNIWGSLPIGDTCFDRDPFCDLTVFICAKWSTLRLDRVNIRSTILFTRSSRISGSNLVEMEVLLPCTPSVLLRKFLTKSKSMWVRRSSQTTRMQTRGIFALKAVKMRIWRVYRFCLGTTRTLMIKYVWFSQSKVWATGMTSRCKRNKICTNGTTQMTTLMHIST